MLLYKLQIMTTVEKVVIEHNQQFSGFNNIEQERKYMATLFDMVLTRATRVKVAY